MNAKTMKTTDMTKGNPLKLILLFAVPMLIGNVFQQIYSIVDTMVAGYNLGDGAIAAIGATSSLYALIIDFAWGMNSGFALVVTRAFGAQNEALVRKTIAGTMLLDSAVTTVLSVIAIVFLKPLMHLMNTPDDVFEDAYIYMFIICLGMIATVAYNMFASFLRAFGNSIVPLYFLIFSSVMNIILDILLVGPMNMGVAGAALATVISEMISAVLSGIYFFRHYKPMLPNRQDFHISKELLGELSSNGTAMAFMYSVVNLGSVFFQGANNKLAETMGNGIITAHTAARRLIGIMMTPLGTITSAAATYIGQNYGANERKRVRAGLRDELYIVVGWGIFACLFIYLFGSLLVRFTTGTSDTEIIKNAVLSLRVHLPFYPALGILLALRTAMQAVDIKAPTVISSSIELGMKIIAAVWLIPLLGFLGTCITEPITWVICAIFLILIYVKKKEKLYGGEAYDRA